MGGDTHLHVISFDIPYPANYGGVIDVFYKVRALHGLGVRVILHCFEYGGRTKAAELEAFCERVYYYRRDMSLVRHLSVTPFIVGSRRDRRLLDNLLADGYPILFEGLHCCWYISHPKLRNRKKVIRMHNIEWNYYANLAILERSLVRRLYFRVESWKLRLFEARNIRWADEIFCISEMDCLYFEEERARSSVLIHPFHGNDDVTIRMGQPVGRNGLEPYVLFHGKLSVSDNEEAAVYLILSVFSKIEVPLVIAGMSPSERLYSVARMFEHVTIIANPGEREMEELIRGAQIHVVMSFQISGMKLKLLNALFRGRYCVVNETAVESTGLESLCDIANEPEEIVAAIGRLIDKPFTKKMVDERRSLLLGSFNNKEHAAQIMRVIEAL